MGLIKKIFTNKVYLILIIFFIVEMWVVITKGNNLYLGDFNLMNNDDVKYIRSAVTLIEENRFSYHSVEDSTVFIMPGYTLILSFFIMIFGKVGGILAVRIFQCILQVISLYLIYIIGKEVFNKKVAFIALFLNALYIPEILVPGLILTEAVFKCILLMLTYISIKGLKTKEIGFYILGGEVWSLGVMVRPTIGLYPIIIFIMMIIYKYSLSEIIKRSALVLSIFIVILSPWWIRNYIEFNRFIPTTLSSGNPFLQGTYINYDQSKGRVGYETSSDIVENDKIEMEVGIQRLKDDFKGNESDYIHWYTIGKTKEYWKYPFYYKNMIDIPFKTVFTYHSILLVLAIINVFVLRNFRNKKAVFLFLVIVYFNIVYLPFFTCSRYSYPTMPFVIIFAANTIYTVYSMFKRYKITC